MMLDLESVRLFVLVVEYGNLTRAAEAGGTVQPAVSVRLKALEAMLGRKLLVRTPRYVRLTDAGARFLEHARKLLTAHDDAMVPDEAKNLHLSIGISDHALGTSFDAALRRMRITLPKDTSLSVRLGQSTEIRELFEVGEIDLAVIRREGAGTDGEVLGEDPLVWRVSPDCPTRRGPVPLVSLPPPCGVRAVAVKTLDNAGISWRDAFVGGSCLALVAAVRAGVGVAPLGRMIGDFADTSDQSDLPPLPSSQIVLLARTPGWAEAEAARALAASVRGTLPRRQASAIVGSLVKLPLPQQAP